MGDTMKTVAGLWIDHRKATIVTISAKLEKIQQIQSNVEKQRGRFNRERSTTSFEALQVQSDGRQQRGFTKNLNDFYNKVQSCISDANAVFIFGPGEAKGELKKIMDENNPSDRVVSVESADKMTDREISAKVRLFFAS